jgi:predicted nucleic acid-binding protein
MSFVLDASVALAWCFGDEESDRGVRILEALRSSDAIVPQLWTLEVANALLVAERRQRLDAGQADRFIRMFLGLPIGADPGSRSAAFREIRQLARTHGLSVYDATYLELALRMSLPLATMDASLRRAAESEGVRPFEPS